MFFRMFSRGPRSWHHGISPTFGFSTHQQDIRFSHTTVVGEKGTNMADRNRTPRLNKILALLGRSKVAYNKCKTIAKNQSGSHAYLFFTSGHIGRRPTVEGFSHQSGVRRL